VGEVEEEFGEDHQVSMVEGKIETVVFACSRMRRNQDIVEVTGNKWFWLLLLKVIKWRRVKHPFFEARSRRGESLRQ
jgi:hypothetical protein